MAQETNKGCFSFVGAGIAFMLLIAVAKCGSCDDNHTQTHSQTANALSEIQPAQIVLTKEDTLALRDALTKIDKQLDFYETNSGKMANQYNRFFRMFQEGSVSQYKAYQAAEVAKETFDRYSGGIGEINVPDKLPRKLKDTLNIAISNIQDYYITEKNAYSRLMDVLNGDGDFKDIDKFKELEQLANSDYLQGVRCLYIVENSLDMYKHNTKKHKKSKV